jgi:uncharacterized protein YbcI
MSQSSPGEPATSSPVVAEIARGVVKIHARYFGRGPTRARAIWRSDVVVVILEEIFTRAEEVLVDADRFDQVRAHRQAFQDHVEPLFRNLVEQATGRSVRAFLSQVSENGIASEVFVLGDAPAAGDPATPPD